MLDAIETMVISANGVTDGNTPDLSDDDILIYADSATWDDWQNHVPQCVRVAWPQLDMKARLVVFLTAKQFTAYKAQTITRTELHALAERAVVALHMHSHGGLNSPGFPECRKGLCSDWHRMMEAR